MTEDEWLTGSGTMPMLAYLRDKVSDRKLRLVRIAAARLEWDRLPFDAHRQAVEAAEAHADGRVTDDELARHSSTLYGFFTTGRRPDFLSDGTHMFHALAHAACQRAMMVRAGSGGAMWSTGVRHLGHRLLPVIRDIIGNPFRSVVADPRWLPPTVVALAGAVYADRAFDRLPILADALEEAGCVDAGVLAHCRGDGPHVRGCWVVDLVLGNE